MRIAVLICSNDENIASINGIDRFQHLFLKAFRDASWCVVLYLDLQFHVLSVVFVDDADDQLEYSKVAEYRLQ